MMEYDDKLTAGMLTGIIIMRLVSRRVVKWRSVLRRPRGFIDAGMKKAFEARAWAIV